MKKCNKEIIRSPRANNVKYCHECRQEAYKYTEYRTQWKRERRDNIATNEVKGKIACVFCGKYYIKPVSHAWQVHGMEEREYKEYAGLDHKKGVIPQHHKELLQNKANYSLVVAKNLLKGGRTTRYKKGGEGVGVYKRSKQTMDRLKYKNFPSNNRVRKIKLSMAKNATKTFIGGLLIATIIINIYIKWINTH